MLLSFNIQVIYLFCDILLQDPFCIRLENIYPRMLPCFEEISLNKLAEEYHEYALSCENVCSGVNLLKLFSPGYISEEDKESHYEAVSKQRAKSFEKIRSLYLIKFLFLLFYLSSAVINVY